MEENIVKEVIDGVICEYDKSKYIIKRKRKNALVIMCGNHQVCEIWSDFAYAVTDIKQIKIRDDLDKFCVYNKSLRSFDRDYINGYVYDVSYDFTYAFIPDVQIYSLNNDSRMEGDNFKCLLNDSVMLGRVYTTDKKPTYLYNLKTDKLSNKYCFIGYKEPCRFKIESEFGKNSLLVKEKLRYSDKPDIVDIISYVIDLDDFKINKNSKIWSELQQRQIDVPNKDSLDLVVKKEVLEYLKYLNSIDLDYYESLYVPLDDAIRKLKKKNK